MQLERQRTNIAEVVRNIEESDDPRMAIARLQNLIRASRQRGQEIPEALARIERDLALWCCAESQGR